jgi:hypothetical protein
MADKAARKGLLLTLDPDKMFADFVCVTEDTPGAVTTYEAARAALNEDKVVYGVNLEAVHEAVDTLGERETNERIRVAEAAAPVHGVDGRIDFAVDVSGQATYRAAEEDDNNIDFRTATSIATVKAGDLLATHVPPQQGTPGRTVRGEPIPPHKPEDPVIRPGQNVEFDAEERTFKAVAEGRPVFAEGVLSVLPVFEIGGDVDYNTGHVEFNGTVIVTGNVLDEFNVTAKAIEVFGTVGASELSAETNITVRGGINGRERARVRAGGSVHTKYVNGTVIECLGDLVVAREAVNSRLLSNGRIRVGNLIGGHGIGRMGIEVKELGSDMGVPTRVEPGVDLQVRKVDETLDVIDGRIEALLQPFKLVLGDKEKFKALTEERRKAFEQAYEQFQKLKAAHEQLAERRGKLMQASRVKPVKEVVVLKQLFPDTIVKTDLCMRNFTKEAAGPLVVKEDVDRSTMVLEPYRGGEKGETV